MTTESASTAAKPRSRTPLIVGAVLLAAAGAATYHFTGGRHVETDDAYVDGNLVRLTPQVTGTVVAIDGEETQYVQQGQLLVQLDPRDSEIAVAQAKATLAQTVREVAQLYVNEQRDQAAVHAQQTQVDRANADLARDQGLAAIHGVSLEDLQHDRDTLRGASAALAQAQATLAATHAAIVGTTPKTHPRVLEAEAALRNAWLANARTRVPAPISGYIVRRAVELGQQVTPSTEMLAIVPVESMWIDANFKETQLRNLRLGQPASVSADMYGSKIVYHGKVLGLTAGTGNALAVLPAQNASGNWIKIVQRLPVRIGLDPQELRAHPLFLGVSTNVTVDAGNLEGAALSEKPFWPAAQSTDAYTAQDTGVDDAIRDIVDTNLGAPAVAHGAAAGKVS
jgi:membrane fusion protein (multidrug efflux system)